MSKVSVLEIETVIVFKSAVTYYLERKKLHDIYEKGINKLKDNTFKDV